MKEYSKVLEFYFDKQKYVMLLDDNNKHFFLKQNKDGSVGYLNFIEFFNLVEVLKNPPLELIASDSKNDSKKKKFKLVPKIIIGNIIMALSLSTITIAHQIYESNKRINAAKVNSNTVKYMSIEDIDEYISKETSNEQNGVDTYLEGINSNYLFVYDNSYLNKVFGNEKVTKDDLINAVNTNPKITDGFRPLLLEYINAVTSKYPDVDLRPFYKNLQTLEIVECTKGELVSASLSISSSGCYNRFENKIYVLKDKKYEKGTWDYQVIYHELSHALRSCSFEENDKKYRVQCEGQNYSSVIIAEALNSLFAVSLFDYPEDDIAYQLQSNYTRVMLDCLDNYSLSDYANKSISYYASKLDEYNNEKNHAVKILELIQFQYNDYHNDRIETSQESYYPIYDYICNMYFKKYIKEGMSYDEAYDVYEKMMSTIMFDVPEEYNIDTNRFLENFQKACELNNIEINVKTR